MPEGFHWGGSQILEVVLSSSWIIKLVLLLLLLFSVVSWAIIFYKYRIFKKEKRATRHFLQFVSHREDIAEMKREAERCVDSSLASLFLEGYRRVYRRGEHGQNGDPARVRGLERSIKSSIQEEIAHQEEYLSFLATTGNVSPFVGLFGTVLGIINAFQEIGRQQTASIATVAPGLAEALVATAAGLFAAIPAVIAYNIFLNRIRVSSSQMEAFSLELMELFEEQAQPEETVRA
ncbi:MAG TPA: MotA/TolQ/ExbB proton channel family protein [Nitrospiria bacterium]|jgi:biopolymer transport protein TolQ